MVMTAERICRLAEKASETQLGQRRVAYRLFREQDDSHLWPVNGKFSVIERAIRRARKFEAQSDVMGTYELCLFLESEQSRIVNAEV
jgi:hypothetical protein